ncbi:MAG TPA: DNA methyltransferase [Candidatus Cloacimonadota bacterium]|nr:DNA methyltransferase [Candidatus Cloacimonadota bacterium]
MSQPNDLLTINEASIWATNFLGKEVTSSNISYLIQYGRIRKIEKNNITYISQKELSEYYHSFNGKRFHQWKRQLGDDLNWALSFDNYKESETTKHVHRLHPYKGKFIPQLVEYFLDEKTDDFKQEVFFHPGDIVLDPFCGSGTTLVQANELGIYAIGIEVSSFNSLISNCKVQKYDIMDLQKEMQKITENLRLFLTDSKTVEFETKLLNELYKFNNIYFPVPEYKYKVRNKLINEQEYGEQQAQKFISIYNKLISEYKIELLQENPMNFLDKWYIIPIKNELNLVFEEIKKVKNIQTKALLSIILSRTMRSCRATTHSDLATLKEPVVTTYYCSKHGKICKPLFSILKWWETYCKDTLNRIIEFDKLRTDTLQYCLTGDSRTINLSETISHKNPQFAELLNKKKIAGIFSSPPYVGMIDYHEQHAYAYDLFGFDRHDELEIGPLYKGKGVKAQESYIQGIADVLLNCKPYLRQDYNVFLVANDKYNLYPIIAEKAGMKIVNQFKRPVLNRTERDKGAYSETIFRLVGID